MCMFVCVFLNGRRHRCRRKLGARGCRCSSGKICRLVFWCLTLQFRVYFLSSSPFPDFDSSIFLLLREFLPIHILLVLSRNLFFMFSFCGNGLSDVFQVMLKSWLFMYHSLKYLLHLYLFFLVSLFVRQQRPVADERTSTRPQHATADMIGFPRNKNIKMASGIRLSGRHLFKIVSRLYFEFGYADLRLGRPKSKF